MAIESSTNSGLKRQLTRAGAAFLLTISPVACGGVEDSVICNSPRATSNLFPGDPSATEDRSTWKNGIAIRTEMPADAEGVVVGYRGQNAANWKDSQPVSPDRAQTIAVLLGNGAVSFSLYVTAPEGSASCANAPAVTFGEPEPVEPLIAADATLPKW